MLSWAQMGSRRLRIPASRALRGIGSSALQRPVKSAGEWPVYAWHMGIQGQAKGHKHTTVKGIRMSAVRLHR